MKLGQSAPRKVAQGMRQRAWWVMRRRVVFTLAELLSTLATGQEKDAESNLGKYLKALADAGILVIVGRTPAASPTSNGCLRYRVAIDNGRQAPVWRHRTRVVFDPNSGACYPQGGHL